MKYNFPKTLYGFYWLVIKKFPWYFGALCLCGIIGRALSVIYQPLTLKWFTQIFQNSANAQWSDVINLFILVAFFFFFPIVINGIVNVLHMLYQQYFNRYKLYLLYKRVYENDVSFFIDFPSGEISAQVREVSGALNALMERFWVAMIGTTAGFLFVIGAMFKMNLWFVVILLSYGVIKIVWEWCIQKHINANQKEQVEEDSKYAGLRSDSINNALTVKYFANTEYENKYIYNGRTHLIYLIKRAWKLDLLQWTPTAILWRIVRLGILAMCFFMIKNGEIGVADAVFVMSASLSIDTAFNSLNHELRKYSQTSVRAKKAYKNIIVEQVVTDKENAKRLSVQNAEIAFEHVSFGYGEHSVLRDFNLTIKPHERVGIVGLSGAGKTTLCNLLLRMYDVNGGAIKINNIDIRDVIQDSLRRSISYVPQDVTLFNRSLLENIKYPKPNSTKANVIAVAKRANIHNDIIRLKDGYNTLVGNHGIKLSGGQRQRISIARALLKDAPILILDEATSALDSQNEMLIQKSLRHAMRGKTTIAIAHRLSTLRNMDRIIVMKHGKIIESGSHKQLLRKRGAYYALWNMQTSGMIE